MMISYLLVCFYLAVSIICFCELVFYNLQELNAAFVMQNACCKVLGSFYFDGPFIFLGSFGMKHKQLSIKEILKIVDHMLPPLLFGFRLEFYIS
jgi:hypothetical protein